MPTRVKELRTARGLTIQQLADLAGVSHPTVLLWEGEPEWVNRAWRIARALGVRPGELFEVLPEAPRDQAEQRLLEVFALLSPEHQQAVLAMAESLAPQRPFKDASRIAG